MKIILYAICRALISQRISLAFLYFVSFLNLCN
jgi:hypothetical protein